MLVRKHFQKRHYQKWFDAHRTHDIHRSWIIDIVSRNGHDRKKHGHKHRYPGVWQLNQDLDSVIQVMVNDIRRAGFTGGVPIFLRTMKI